MNFEVNNVFNTRNYVRKNAVEIFESIKEKWNNVQYQIVHCKKLELAVSLGK